MWTLVLIWAMNTFYYVILNIMCYYVGITHWSRAMELLEEKHKQEMSVAYLFVVPQKQL